MSLTGNRPHRPERRRAPFAIACIGLLAAAGIGPGLSRGPDPEKRLESRLRRIAALTRAHGAGAEAVRRELEHLDRFGQVDLESFPPRVQVKLVVDTEATGPFREAGAEVRGRMGPVVSARVPIDALERLARLPGVRSVQPAKRYRPAVDIGRVDIKTVPAFDRFGLTGRGVLIAVVDTGIDWRHRDFRHADGSTRIAAIWDQTDGSGLPPAGFSFGTAYTRQQIDDALIGFGLPLATEDGFGHGTHVAGTALGNGLATGNGQPGGVYVGVAPEADLLVVRVFDNAGAFCGNCDLTAALSWIDQQAISLGKPVVVNMSLGSDYGPHDGTDPDEIALDAFVAGGRAVVVAAGNSRNDGIHTEGDVLPGGGLAIRTFGIPPFTPTGGRDGIYLDMWHDPADSFRTIVQSPGSAFTCTHTTGGPVTTCDTADGQIRIEDRVDPVLGNGDREVLLQVTDAAGVVPRDGTWTVRVEDDSVNGSGHFDIWIYDWALGGQWPIDWNVDVVQELVTSPATAQGAIAVGAYTTRQCWPSLVSPSTCYSSSPTLQEITSFSSPGPTRDDPTRDYPDPGRVRTKPDISAPGQGVVASFSADAVVWPGDAWVSPDGVHRNWQGTSMASPHVAGAVALLFEANPLLGGRKARRFLRTNARLDSFTGPEKNDDWGWGKVDVEAAVEDMLNLITDLTSGPAEGQFTSSGIGDASSYNVYRGSLADLDGSYYGSCFQSGLATPDFTDATPDPSPGQGYFYLMTALEGAVTAVEGSLGQKSDGSLRPNLNPCPA